MIGAILTVFVLVSPQFSSGSEVCHQEINVPYTVYHNEHLNASLYLCPVSRTSCESPFSKVKQPHISATRRCVTNNYGEDTFEEPSSYKDKHSGRTFKVKLCTMQAKADIVEDVIHLPWENGLIEKYTTGYYVSSFGTITWSPVDSCNLVPIYKGHVDALSFGTERYLIGEISKRKFSLKLIKNRRLCNRDIWETDQLGILAASSESTPEEVSAAHSHLLKFEGDVIERLCNLTIDLSVQRDTTLNLQKDLLKLAIVGVVVMICLVCVMAYCILQCIGNCVVLKKRGNGVPLTRCLSTSSINNYVYGKCDDPLREVHHYDTVS